MISQNAQTHKNVFDLGLNKDTNKNFIESRQYTDAHNLSVVEGSNFFSLKNIKGTDNIFTISPNFTSTTNRKFNQTPGTLLSPWYNSGAGVGLLAVNWYVTSDNKAAISASGALTSGDVTKYLTQNYNTVTSQSYNISFKIVTNALGNYTGTVDVYFSNGTTRDLALTEPLGVDGTVSGTFIALNNYDRIELVITSTYTGYNGDVTATIDDFYVSDVPVDYPAKVLKMFNTNYLIKGELVKCLTIITVEEGGLFKIWCFDLEHDTMYEVYEETTPDNYITDDRCVDGFIYPENGIDILYFTDNYNEIRKVRCEIPDPYVANFLDTFDLSLAKRGANGEVILSESANGGSLLTGSYQFSYQFVSPDTNKTTKWSLLSNPILLYNKDDKAGVGLGTTKKIVVRIVPTEVELANFTHFRLAIVENIYPEGVTNLNASLTETYAIADYISGSTISNVQYTANLQNDLVPLSEIIIDTAAIETVKTLTQRDNRLIAGNVKYRNLEYDNGTPTISGGEVLKSSDVTPVQPLPTNEDLWSKYGAGYFRDEVYRFAISYFDEFGNFSSPVVLDTSGVVGNRSESGASEGSSNKILNPSFDNGLLYWGQTGLGSWAAASRIISGFVTDNVAAALVGPASPVTETIYTSLSDYLPLGDKLLLKYRASIVPNNTMSGVNYITSSTFEVVYLDNAFSILGTTSIPITEMPTDVGLPAEETVLLSSIPVGTEYLGFRGDGTDNEATGIWLSLYEVSVTSPLSDMKFPSRQDVIGGVRYSILEGTTPVNLGIRFTDVQNHPTWAKGFVILRAKRKKNILWQSPLIPMMSVYGLGSIAKYPETARETTTLTTANYPDAKPMGPSTTYLPQNLFWPWLRKIIKNTNNSGGSSTNTTSSSEAKMIYIESSGVLAVGLQQGLSMVFPDSTMYTENSKYTYSSSHSLEAIDACLLSNFTINHNSTLGVIPGDNLNTSVSGLFYALKDSVYYYDANHSGAKEALRTANHKPTGYKSFDNLSEGTSLNGKDIMLYSNITTEGISWEGIKNPSIQRGAVMDIPEFLPINIKNDVVLGPQNRLTFAAAGTVLTPTWTPNLSTFKAITTRDETQFVNTLEIVNCVVGLSDDRYGDVNSDAEYIYTGTKVIFTNAELSNVSVGSPVLKTVDVWGGDCMVSSHIFKLTDSTVGVLNQAKFNVPQSGEAHVTTAGKWGRVFQLGSTNAGITMPVVVKNADQYVQVYLESEFNGEVTDINYLELPTGFGATEVHRMNLKESNCRTPLPYTYNINISKQNEQKLFFSVDEFAEINTQLKARIVYSDLKIYQSNIDGFDTIRVGNYYDMSETYGGITKLIPASDNLYAIQEYGTSYIGVGERVLEATDASQLAVRSGDIIGNVILLDSIRGSQHINSVISDGNTIFYADNINKTINRVQGQEVTTISDLGMATEFRTIFQTDIPENMLLGTYDPIKKQYWISNIDGTKCYVFNILSNTWISNIEFPADNLLASLYTNNKLYIIGRGSDTGALALHTMYTGPYNYLLGTTVNPRVTFIVNPDPDIGKTFDNVLVNSSDRMSSATFIVYRESALGSQVANGISLDVSSRGEGNYRVKILKDNLGARLRGLNMDATIFWKNSQNEVALSSVITKYRQSQNIF